MPPALLRQRRNLMVVSMMVLFMVIAGAKLDKVVFLGVQMSFDNPDAIVWFLELFLVYFLYRYYLYLIQEPDLLLKSTFYGRLNSLVFKKIQQRKDELYPDVTMYSGEYDFRKMQKVGLIKRKVQAVVARKEHECIYGEFEINVIPYAWDAFRALLYTLFNRSYVTDYVLPFVVAFVAIIFSWDKWA